jgi:hypothetical protein
MVSLVGVLGVGSFISLLAFFVYGVTHRQKLNQLREESRRRVAELLGTRLGNVPSPPVQADLIPDKSPGLSQIAAADNASPPRFDSAPLG